MSEGKEIHKKKNKEYCSENKYISIYIYLRVGVRQLSTCIIDKELINLLGSRTTTMGKMVFLFCPLFFPLKKKWDNDKMKIKNVNGHC